MRVVHTMHALEKKIKILLAAFFIKRNAKKKKGKKIKVKTKRLAKTAKGMKRGLWRNRLKGLLTRLRSDSSSCNDISTRSVPVLGILVCERSVRS